MFHGHPASEQGPLTTGERLCDLDFLDHHGKPFSLYANHVFGWPKAVFLIGSAERESDELARFAASVRDFGQVETHVLAVTRGPADENARLVKRLGLPFPLLSDPTGELHGALHKAAGLEATFRAGISQTF